MASYLQRTDSEHIPVGGRSFVALWSGSEQVFHKPLVEREGRLQKDRCLISQRQGAEHSFEDWKDRARLVVGNMVIGLVQHMLVWVRASSTKLVASFHQLLVAGGFLVEGKASGISVSVVWVNARAAMELKMMKSSFVVAESVSVQVACTQRQRSRPAQKVD